jgi:hypothetical protein
MILLHSDNSSNILEMAMTLGQRGVNLWDAPQKVTWAQ